MERLGRVGIVPLALTASLVLLVAGAFLYQATHHSSRVLAAELAADHVKCFAANSLLGTHDAPAAVERSMMSAFGWQLHLPEQFDASGLELVGSRRCLYGEGKVAHLMYRDRRPARLDFHASRSAFGRTSWSKCSVMKRPSGRLAIARSC